MSNIDNIELKELKRAFGTYLTGVTVVTTKSADDEYVGLTVNSFTSVSLDPPLLSICISKSLPFLPAFEQCSHFAVNVLADDQEDVSNIFAAYDGDRFAKVDWKNDENECPIIVGVTTHFSCSKFKQVDAGDHIIFLGEVISFETTGNEGLGYSNQGYFSLGQKGEDEVLPSSVNS